jgi:hypothetical protein
VQGGAADLGRLRGHGWLFPQNRALTVGNGGESGQIGREGGKMLLKIGSILLEGVILLGGLIAMALAGILAALVTEPHYPLAMVFLPFAVVVVTLAGFLMGKVVRWLYPQHPDRKLWIAGAWAAAFLILGLWGYQVYDFFTKPMHWQ